MFVLPRNVNQAFNGLVSVFHEADKNSDLTAYAGSERIEFMKKPYKNPNGSGYRLQCVHPVMIRYSHPKERVLFNSARDANPFLSLYEALYCLDGRQEVAPLVYYSKNMKTFSDDGRTLNGIYGWRWRCAKGLVEFNEPYTMYYRRSVDQINVLVDHLKRNPDSSRAVLAMWNVEDDLLKIGGECEECKGTGRKLYDEYSPMGGKTGFKLDYEEDAPKCNKCDGKGTTGSKDVCCNLSVIVSLRESKNAANLCSLDISPSERSERWGKVSRVLDISVTNRSNDLIWGLLGSNYVQFSILQEYLAARLGVEVGEYTHFTSNLHVYDWNWKPEQWLKEDMPINVGLTYPSSMKLVDDVEAFDKELPLLLDKFSGDEEAFKWSPISFSELFLQNVCNPMFLAYKCYKMKAYVSARKCAEEIQADDWRIACLDWLERREERRKEKSNDRV